MKTENLDPTDRQQSLFSLRDFYAGDDWDQQQLLILSQAVMFGCFPYRKTTKSSFTRTIRTRKGTITIKLTALEEGIPLPYGKDRVYLGCALTQARRKQTPGITFEELDPLLAQFGESYKDYGGEDYKRFKERWDRLTNCGITIRRGPAEDINSEGKSKKPEGKNRFIIAQFNLPHRRPSRKKSSRDTQLTVETEPKYGILFGADFWNDYLEFCVPMPVPLMKLFTDQPLAWDIATLIHWASFSAIVSRRRGGSGEKVLTRKDLFQILGSADSNPRRLFQSITDVLKQMRTVWPELNVKINIGADLVIGVPLHEKLLVQEREYDQQIRFMVEQSYQGRILSGGSAAE